MFICVQNESFYTPRPNPLPQGERELYNHAFPLMEEHLRPPPLMGGVGEGELYKFFIVFTINDEYGK